MTTIACNLFQMAADSLVSHDDIGTGSYLGSKLHRIRRSIFGEAGEDISGVGLALDWLVNDYTTHQPPLPEDDWDWNLLELAPDGIFVWDTWMRREPIRETTMAIGSGRKVALYCMRFLAMNPAEAIAEAAKVDHHTREPVVVLNLKSSKRKKR